jgi:hypothetical protein
MAPCGAAFGVCGYFWRRLPGGWHRYLTPAGCAVAACGFAVLAAELRGGRGGGTGPEISGHAVAVTLACVAVTAGLGVAGAIPLARTVRASPASGDLG